MGLKLCVFGQFDLDQNQMEIINSLFLHPNQPPDRKHLLKLIIAFTSKCGFSTFSSKNIHISELEISVMIFTKNHKFCVKFAIQEMHLQILARKFSVHF